MCGIAGFALKGGFEAELAEREARAMADAIIHRGPDGSGVWTDSQVGIAMAHRRLSIIDLSPTGAQPMISPSGRYVISYNGEIYNHNDIRDELRNAGFEWRGTSDTESLLAGIETWGLEKTLKKAVGMFAFALWDKEKRELSLARDRMGEKPLYYGSNNGRFFFGSELKTFKAHPQFRGEVDRDVVALFLRHNCIPAPYSIYHGIRKLTPGTCLSIPAEKFLSADEIEPITYWSLEQVAYQGQSQLFSGTEEEAVNELERLLQQSVNGQSVADVPLGAFLSGGIDSSMVVALMQAGSAKPVKTFTIGFDESGYNEAKHAKAVARHLGTEHTELYVSPEEARDVIPKLPSLYDEPFADSSQIPTSLISQLTRKHVTVSLSGDGGDELFGGYNRYLWTRSIWNATKWLPSPMQGLTSRMLESLSEKNWDALYGLVDFAVPKAYKISQAGIKMHKLARVITATNPDLIYRALISHWKSPCRVVPHSQEPDTVLTGEIGGVCAEDIEQRMMLLDGLTYLPDDILVKVDRAAMSESLETRVPLLDHRIVEFAWRVPLKMKIKNGTGKWLLRKLLAKHVPQELFERPKMGFAIPLDSWLRGPLRDWAEDLLSEKRLNEEGVFDASIIRRTWARHLEGKPGVAHQLWDILVYQSWSQANCGPASNSL